MNLSLKALREALSQSANQTEADIFASDIRASASPDDLAQGIHQIEETTVLWVVQTTGDVSPTLVSRTLTEDGSAWSIWRTAQVQPQLDPLALDAVCQPMQRLGSTNLFVAFGDPPNFSATAYRVEIGDQKLRLNWVVLEYFQPEDDCLPQPYVERGTVTEHIWRSDETSVFPGTVRGYWLYVPAQYRADTPACLMVFQDGGMYLHPPAPVPTVFDNLIHKGDMPVTVGLFINPGTFPDQPGRFQNRSIEYDSCTNRYATFLRDELIPAVAQTLHLRTDAASHAIGGISSGGACAFTAAWEMPELFSKVLSHAGSFTNIRGAHNYWTLIRSTERKPIRVCLQDGSNDIDDICGNWFLANHELAAALRFREYDYHFDHNRGYHSLAHGGATLPSTLRWLWRDHAQRDCAQRDRAQRDRAQQS